MGILVWRIKRGLRSLDGVERYVELVDGEFGAYRRHGLGSKEILVLQPLTIGRECWI